MVSCQESPPLKVSKHSLQHPSHDAALVNALSLVQGVTPATALHIAGT